METVTVQNEVDPAAEPKPESSEDKVSFAITNRRGGPRTQSGKRRSGQNAVKHGIFSKAVVLPNESAADFDRLLAGYRDSLQPLGAFEEDLVEKLAAIQWRLRRLLSAESAEIQMGAEFIEADNQNRYEVEASRITYVQLNGGLIRNIANPKVLTRCLDLLVELRDSIRQDNFDQKYDEDVLALVYGKYDKDNWQRNLFENYRRFFGAANASEEVRKELNLDTPEEYKALFLEFLEDEIKRLKHYQKDQASIESSRLKLTMIRRNVPESPRLDALLRYEASLERAFDRALNQLERLQRIRLGESVPPEHRVRITQEP
jgi:hypothetical protein